MQFPVSYNYPAAVRFYRADNIVTFEVRKIDLGVVIADIV